MYGIMTTVNPDNQFVKDLTERINQNGGYCISKQDKIPENICICEKFRTTNICDCGLFINVPDPEVMPEE